MSAGLAVFLWAVVLVGLTVAVCGFVDTWRH